jgi:hypothetical protein
VRAGSSSRPVSYGVSCKRLWRAQTRSSRVIEQQPDQTIGAKSKNRRARYQILSARYPHPVFFTAALYSHRVTLQKTGHAVDATTRLDALADVDDVAANSGGLVLLAHG